MIFSQIVSDFKATHCIRMCDADKIQFKKFLDSKFITPAMLFQQEMGFKPTLKKHVIEIAKTWPFYFTRFFPVAVSINSE